MTNPLEVNFLAEKQAEYEKQRRRLLLIQVSAFSLLVIYILGLSGLFAYSFYLNQKKKSLETKAKVLSAQVQELSPIEAKYLFIKTKLDALSPILASQRKNQDLVEAILTLLTPGISVSGLNVTEDGNISFSGEAIDFAALNQFLTNLERGSLTPSVRLQLAEIKGVGLRSEGSYNFSIVLKLIGTEQKVE